MNSRRTVLPLALAVSALVPGCNPYKFDGPTYNAGYLDATSWPAQYVGKSVYGGAVPSKDGEYEVYTTTGVANGAAINYFLFAYSATVSGGQVVAGQEVDPDPASLLAYPSDDLPYSAKAYVFDPGAANPLPVAGSGTAKCVQPKNYVFNQRTDTVRYDEQGTIFGSTTGDTTAQPNPLNPGLSTTQPLPDDAEYAPIYQEVAVKSNGERCQDIKSEDIVMSNKNIVVPVDNLGDAKPDGKFLGWAMVDPSTAISPNLPFAGGGTPTTLGPGRWGWWNHYLAQYLDGGYIPTTSASVQASDTNYAVAKNVTYTQYTFKTQDLWLATIYPVTNPNFDATASINSASAVSPAASPLPDFYLHAPNVNCDTGDGTATFQTAGSYPNGTNPCTTNADCTGMLPNTTCVPDPTSKTNGKVCVGVAGGTYSLNAAHQIVYTGGSPAVDASMAPIAGYLDSLGVFLNPIPVCTPPTPGLPSPDDAANNGIATASTGFDLALPRGDAGYSPICRIRAYTPTTLDYSNIPDPQNANHLIPVQDISPGLIRPADYIGPTAPHTATANQTGMLDQTYGTDAVLPPATIADTTNVVADANGNPYAYCLQLN